MTRSISTFLTLLFFTSILCSCSPFKPTDERAAICNELNSKLIFNGSTSNIRQAEIENAQDPLVQRSYENNHCDK